MLIDCFVADDVGVKKFYRRSEIEELLERSTYLSIFVTHANTDHSLKFLNRTLFAIRTIPLRAFTHACTPLVPDSPPDSSLLALATAFSPASDCDHA